MTIAVPTPPASVEALLRAERTIPSQPNEVRDRVLRRARSAQEVAHAAAPRQAFLRGLVSIGTAMLAVAALGIATYPRSSRSAGARPPIGAPASSAPPAEDEDAPLPLESVPAVNDVPHVAPSPSVHAAPSERTRRSAEDEALELRLLERARRELDQSDFSGARSALAAHERQFPRGRLAEEREALKVKALAGLGKRDEARHVAAVFRKRFPQSVLLPRMEDISSGP